MALSDEEERLLHQMEAALAAEDPKLSHTLSGRGSRRVHRRRAALAGVGFFAGLALLILGMSTQLFFSVLGFVVMLAAAITAIYAWQHVNDVPSDAARSDRLKTPQSAPNSQGFMDRMEERWRKRREDETGF
jgi:high-affinity Fe2+/Pb2+ permease